ncbi:hypothetical protein HAX54_017571 [Datura stramonium]|uniref:ULTRAPETALA1/2 SAND domain-containing protein n=1 Tax=Datura stramonium TaxID=4076 RepID=A0ABS8S1A6_DATST|nr:hypothetical protein [Datura stramonium]
MCGVHQPHYGDAVARLRVFSSGELEITCDCTPGCQEGSIVDSVLSLPQDFLSRFAFCLAVKDLTLMQSSVCCVFKACSFWLTTVFLFDDKLSPAAFEKHSGRETARKWKNNIWIIVNEERPGSVSAQKKSAKITMMLWRMCIGSALVFLMTECHVMMKRNEQAVEIVQKYSRSPDMYVFPIIDSSESLLLMSLLTYFKTH